jgi:hypothetical protein
LNPISIPGDAFGVAGIAGSAVVGISGDLPVMGIDGRFVVGMAVRAAELTEIAREMAVRTADSRVFPRLDRKVVLEDGL